MRWFKFSMFALILALVGLFINQNLSSFLTVIPFGLDLYIPSPLKWSHPVYILILGSGLAGFFIGVLLMLKPYFNIRRLLANERNEKQHVQRQATPEETTSESVTLKKTTSESAVLKETTSEPVNLKEKRSEPVSSPPEASPPKPVDEEHSS